MVLVLVLVGVLGCTSATYVYKDGSEVVNDNATERCKYIEFDGHIYVFYDGGYQGGITHCPECPCYKKDIDNKNN